MIDAVYVHGDEAKFSRTFSFGHMFSNSLSFLSVCRHRKLPRVPADGCPGSGQANCPLAPGRIFSTISSGLLCQSHRSIHS